MEKLVAELGIGMAGLGLAAGFVIGSSWLWLSVIGLTVCMFGMAFWEE